MEQHGAGVQSQTRRRIKWTDEMKVVRRVLNNW